MTDDNPLTIQEQLDELHSFELPLGIGTLIEPFVLAGVPLNQAVAIVFQILCRIAGNRKHALKTIKAFQTRHHLRVVKELQELAVTNWIVSGKPLSWSDPKLVH